MLRFNSHAGEPDITGEWKTDEHGRRYREVGKGIVEHEMTVMVSGGIEIPVSQLEDYNRRMKEAEERRRAEALEELKKRPAPKVCPFSSDMSNTCKREKCALFLNDKCSIAAIADVFGVELAEKTTGKCPFSIYARCEGCAMNNNGCAIVRLAASTANK